MPEGMEDNYVDELFLSGMPHKNSFPDLHYPVMIKNTVEIVHIVNSVFLQIRIFYILMHSEKAAKIENVFFYITVVLSIIGYIFYRYFKLNPLPQETEEQPALPNLSETLLKFCRNAFSIIFSTDFFNDCRTILFLTMILVMLTPVLGNLTATVTDNSIIVFYTIFVFVHLIQYDFQMIINKPEMTDSLDQIELRNNLKGASFKKSKTEEEQQQTTPKKKNKAS